ncbi:aspartate and serine-rich protein-like [Uloborus diversus]|uniref:aspartate and serine-rich protein-like n=1 Tax=Uloborus diversus TaxID=327109 RepID=UPI002409B43C|nr:aspartate and serine-rich protein-like [Uloborus diversus]
MATTGTECNPVVTITMATTSGDHHQPNGIKNVVTAPVNVNEMLKQLKGPSESDSDSSTSDSDSSTSDSDSSTSDEESNSNEALRHSSTSDTESEDDQSIDDESDAKEWELLERLEQTLIYALKL